MIKAGNKMKDKKKNSSTKNTTNSAETAGVGGTTSTTNKFLAHDDDEESRCSSEDIQAKFLAYSTNITRFLKIRLVFFLFFGPT